MSLLEAIRFLTLIPLPFGLPKDQRDYEKNIAASMRWFPLVGVLIGLVGAGTGWVAAQFWGSLVQAVFVVIAMAMVTGGLHLDGLSDTFDAMLSWRSRERKLEIMKDSRIGAMGALALVAVLLLKVTLISSLTGWLGLILAPVIGRWVDLYGIFFFPAANEGGLGRGYRDHTRLRDFIFATVLTAVIVAGLAWFGSNSAVAFRMLIGWLLAFAVGHVIFARWTRTLGGLTGDIYGALCEIAEVVVLATMSASI